MAISATADVPPTVLKNMPYEFDAVIEASGSGGAYVTIPADAPEVFNRRGQVRVLAAFDGVPYRGSVTTMGGIRLLIILKDIREQIGKQPGDTVRVGLAEDTAPRVVEVPDDFAAALGGAPAARAAFDDFSYTHRKEYVQWIEDAKKPETRARRIAKALEMLARGEKR